MPVGIEIIDAYREFSSHWDYGNPWGRFNPSPSARDCLRHYRLAGTMSKKAISLSLKKKFFIQRKNPISSPKILNFPHSMNPLVCPGLDITRTRTLRSVPHKQPFGRHVFALASRLIFSVIRMRWATLAPNRWFFSHCVIFLSIPLSVQCYKRIRPPLEFNSMLRPCIRYARRLSRP